MRICKARVPFGKAVPNKSACSCTNHSVSTRLKPLPAIIPELILVSPTVRPTHRRTASAQWHCRDFLMRTTRFLPSFHYSSSPRQLRTPSPFPILRVLCHPVAVLVTAFILYCLQYTIMCTPRKTSYNKRNQLWVNNCDNEGNF